MKSIIKNQMIELAVKQMFMKHLEKFFKENTFYKHPDLFKNTYEDHKVLKLKVLKKTKYNINE